MREHTDNCRLAYWLYLQINGERDFVTAREFMLGFKRDPITHVMIMPGTEVEKTINRSSFKGRKSMAKKKSIYNKGEASFITEAA